MIQSSKCALNDETRTLLSVDVIFFINMMSDWESGTSGSETTELDDLLMAVRRDFISKYGDETSPDFDYKRYRRKLANEKVQMPKKESTEITDPIISRHEELVHRLVRNSREVQRVIRQVESMQDQIDSIEEKLTRMETNVERTRDCVTVIGQELRNGQLNHRQRRNQIHNVVE